MKQNEPAALHRPLVQAIADFGLAVGLIWLISLGTTAQHGTTFLLFSLSAATIAALDLAFLRHLRRAYASRHRCGRRKP